MTVHPERAGFDPVPETALSLQTGLTDIIAHRDAALAEMTKAAAALDAAYDLAQSAATTAHAASHGKTYYGNDRTESAHYDALFRGRFDPATSLDVFRKHLDASVWTHLLEATRMRDLMDITDREAFDRDLMGEVPDITFETVTATFNRLRQDADLIFKRGLATAFSKLDRRFKSHDGFKIGSRIILTHVFDGWGSWNYHGRARDTIVDVERVFAILDNHNPNPGSLISAIERSRGSGLNPRQSDCEASYFRIKGFMNGNAHIWFMRDDLVQKANKLLADYYGAALGDAMDANATTEDLRTDIGLPAKTLAFFPTAEAVIEDMMINACLRPGQSVLEPSAGTGNIARAALAKGAHVHAIEIHPDRVRALEAIDDANLTVSAANFLHVPSAAEYDLVLMNPPFEGTHWMGHVYHAFGFLRPGGRLVAVLPAGAEVNETKRHEEFRAWADRYRANYRLFSSLPPESFAESGTRVQTVILTLKAPEAAS